MRWVVVLALLAASATAALHYELQPFGQGGRMALSLSGSAFLRVTQRAQLPNMTALFNSTKVARVYPVTHAKDAQDCLLTCETIAMCTAWVYLSANTELGHGRSRSGCSIQFAHRAYIRGIERCPLAQDGAAYPHPESGEREGHTFDTIAGGQKLAQTTLSAQFRGELLDTDLDHYQVVGNATAVVNKLLLKPPRPDVFDLLSDHLASLKAALRKTNQISAILFYSEDCPFSIEFMPHYLLFRSTFPDVFVARVDSKQAAGQYADFGVDAFPTVVFLKGETVWHRIPGPRSIQDLHLFMSQKTSIAPIGQSTPLIDTVVPLSMNRAFFQRSLLSAFDEAVVRGSIEEQLSILADVQELYRCFDKIAVRRSGVSFVRERDWAMMGSFAFLGYYLLYLFAQYLLQR